MSFSTIGNILNRNLKQKGGLAGQVTAALVCDEFDKLIEQKWGNKMRHKVKALFFKENVLTIASLSSVAAQEIKLHEVEILDELNQQFGNLVERIRYLM